MDSNADIANTFARNAISTNVGRRRLMHAVFKIEMPKEDLDRLLPDFIKEFRLILEDYDVPGAALTWTVYT